MFSVLQERLRLIVLRSTKLCNPSFFPFPFSSPSTTMIWINIGVILCHLPCSYAKPCWQTQTYFSPPLLLPVWSVENIRAKLWSSCISSLFVLKPRNCTTIFLRERQEIKQFNWEFEQRRQIVIFSDTNVSHFRSLGSLPQRRGTKWMMPRSIVVNQPQVRFNNDSLLFNNIGHWRFFYSVYLYFAVCFMTNIKQQII